MFSFLGMFVYKIYNVGILNFFFLLFIASLKKVNKILHTIEFEIILTRKEWFMQKKKKKILSSWIGKIHFVVKRLNVNSVSLWIHYQAQDEENKKNRNKENCYWQSKVVCLLFKAKILDSERSIVSTTVALRHLYIKIFFLKFKSLLSKLIKYPLEPLIQWLMSTAISLQSIFLSSSSFTSKVIAIMKNLSRSFQPRENFAM